MSALRLVGTQRHKGVSRGTDRASEHMLAPSDLLTWIPIAFRRGIREVGGYDEALWVLLEQPGPTFLASAILWAIDDLVQPCPGRLA